MLSVCPIRATLHALKPPLFWAKDTALHGIPHQWGSSALWLLVGSCQLAGTHRRRERSEHIFLPLSLSLSLSLPPSLPPSPFPPTSSALPVIFYQRSWLLMGIPSPLQLPHSPWVPWTFPSPNHPSFLLILGCFTTPRGISASTDTFVNNPFMRLSLGSPLRVPSVSFNDHDQYCAWLAFLAFVSVYQVFHSFPHESKLEKNKPTTGCTTLHN